MAKKNPSPEALTSDTGESLHQVRDILFGAQMRTVDGRLAQLEERYANPLFRLPMTFMEIFPVGFLITLLAAALLRNSRFLAAAT